MSSHWTQLRGNEAGLQEAARKFSVQLDEAVVSLAVPLSGTPVQTPRLFDFLPMDAETVATISGYVDAHFFADIDRRSLKPPQQVLA